MTHDIDHELIEQGDASFDRVSHAHLVHVGQQGRKVDLEIEVHRLMQPMAAADRVEMRADGCRRIGSVDRRGEIK